MAKQLLFSEDALSKLKRGVDSLAIPIDRNIGNRQAKNIQEWKRASDA